MLRRALMLASVLAAGAACAAPAQAANTGVFAFVPADPAVVRAEGHIPARWKLLLDNNGKASLFVQALSADVTIDGQAHPYVWAAISAVLDSSALPAPERDHATSDVEGAHSDIYVISWSVNDRDFADWLRAGTGLGTVVQYVPGLKFSLGPGVTDAFAFTAPIPAPSPFEFTANLTAPIFPVTADVANWWRETPNGTVLIESNDHNEQLGAFQQWKLTTDPATPLGRMVGSSEVTDTCGLNNIAEPLAVLTSQEVKPGCFARETFTATGLRKQIAVPRPPAPAPAACASSRSVTAHLHLLRGERMERVVVRLGGHRLRVLRFGRGWITFELPASAHGRLRVAISVYGTLHGHRHVFRRTRSVTRC